MVNELEETRQKARDYYSKVGELHIDPWEIPESPSEMELHVAWFFDRIRSIVSIENSRRKFGDVNEILVLLGAAAGDLGLSITFKYYEDIGQWMLYFNDPMDYLNLPLLAKHFGTLYRFKWAPDRLNKGNPNEVFEDAEVVHEGSEDIFAYVRSEHGVD